MIHLTPYRQLASKIVRRDLYFLLIQLTRSRQLSRFNFPQQRTSNMAWLGSIIVTAIFAFLFRLYPHDRVSSHVWMSLNNNAQAMWHGWAAKLSRRYFHSCFVYTHVTASALTFGCPSTTHKQCGVAGQQNCHSNVFILVLFTPT